ncbi:MAG: polysaccharide biosynthesis/export family protein [Candidatus Saccharibacteria bacterium]|nr:polysaccharide biosynthesis/export family protein [Pseudorhodobacter sp.]
MKSLFSLLAAISFGLMTVSPAMAQGYGVRPGDTLKIEVVEDPTLDRSVLVGPDGRTSVPQAGTFLVSGNRVETISETIATKLAANFASKPTVVVSLESLAVQVPASGGPVVAATISVYVLGEAAKSGRLALEPGTTVLQAFAEMGGFSKFAATQRVLLRRTDARTKVPATYLLNYPAILAGTTTAGDITLQSGDVILVPQRGLFE